MVLCLSFLGPLFTPVAYHDPLLFAELLGHYLAKAVAGAIRAVLILMEWGLAVELPN